MSGTERRASRRHVLAIPITFRFVVDDKELAINCHTRDICPQGVCFRSPIRLPIGEPLFMTVRIPVETAGYEGYLLECYGHIVHERILPSGDLSYGVEFERMQSMFPDLGETFFEKGLVS